MRALPPRLHLEATDPETTVVWPAADGERATLVCSLRPLDEGDAKRFWAGELDADLLRYPVDAARGRTTLTLPVGRALELMLIVRDGAGAVVATPRLRLRPAAPSQAQLEGPVRHEHGPEAMVPLVFADGADLGALAARVARRVTGADVAPTAPRPPAGFGARQRWYLTRLRWTPPSADAPLTLVVRDQVIAASEVADWSEGPPPDAIPLPAGTDGLVDGRTRDGATAFFVVLAGPAPWRPLPVSPALPPFTAVRSAAPIGEVEARLGAALDAHLANLEGQPLALAELAPALALARAAAAVLPPGHPAHAAVEAAEARSQRGSRF